MSNTSYVNTLQQGIPVNPKIIYLNTESVIWQKWTDSLEQTDLIVQSHYATLLETYRVAVVLLIYVF